MKILILDDDQIRHNAFKQKLIGSELVHVYTAEEAIEKLQHEEFDIAFLDHDLGGHVYVDSHGEEATGYTVAKWLHDNEDRKPQHICIHSYNPVGAKNMCAILPGSKLTPGIWNII